MAKNSESEKFLQKLKDSISKLDVLLKEMEEGHERLEIDIKNENNNNLGAATYVECFDKLNEIKKTIIDIDAEPIKNSFNVYKEKLDKALVEKEKMVFELTQFQSICTPTSHSLMQYCLDKLKNAIKLTEFILKNKKIKNIETKKIFEPYFDIAKKYLQQAETHLKKHKDSNTEMSQNDKDKLLRDDADRIENLAVLTHKATKKWGKIPPLPNYAGGFGRDGWMRTPLEFWCDCYIVTEKMAFYLMDIYNKLRDKDQYSFFG